MSTLNRLCDICGGFVGPVSPEYFLHSDKTNRLWCKECHKDKTREIVVWLYNEGSEFPIKKTEEVAYLSHPPLPRSANCICCCCPCRN